MILSTTYNGVEFASVREMADAIRTHKYERNDHRSASFLGSNPDTVMRAAVNGDQSLVLDATRMMDRFAHLIETPTWMDNATVAGAYPMVPDYLQGEPECMRLPELSGSTSAPLSVLVDLTTSAGISAQAMRLRGVAVLSLVMSLAAVRPVELKVCTIMDGTADPKTGNSVSVVLANINTTPLDLQTACATLTNVGIPRLLFYGVAKSFGFSGSWPTFAGVRSANGHRDLNDAYTAKVRSVLGMTSEVLYVPPVYYDDPVFGKDANLKDDSAAVQWVADKIARYAHPDLQEAA